MKNNRDLFYYIGFVLAITLLLALYIGLVDPFEVCYCMDEVQEKIEIIKQEISKVQNEIRLCNHDLDSGVLSQEEHAEISDYKADLTNRRKNFMDYLGKFRELESKYVDAKVVITSKK